MSSPVKDARWAQATAGLEPQGLGTAARWVPRAPPRADVYAPAAVSRGDAPLIDLIISPPQGEMRPRGGPGRLAGGGSLAAGGPQPHRACSQRTQAAGCWAAGCCPPTATWPSKAPGLGARRPAFLCCAPPVVIIRSHCPPSPSGPRRLLLCWYRGQHDLGPTPYSL